MSTSADVTAGVCMNPLTGNGWVFVIWQTPAFPAEGDFTGGQVWWRWLDRMQVTCAADRDWITPLLFFCYFYTWK